MEAVKPIIYLTAPPEARGSLSHRQERDQCGDVRQNQAAFNQDNYKSSWADVKSPWAALLVSQDFFLFQSPATYFSSLPLPVQHDHISLNVMSRHVHHTEAHTHVSSCTRALLLAHRWGRGSYVCALLASCKNVCFNAAAMWRQKCANSARESRILVRVGQQLQFIRLSLPPRPFKFNDLLVHRTLSDPSAIVSFLGDSAFFTSNLSAGILLTQVYCSPTTVSIVEEKYLPASSLPEVWPEPWMWPRPWPTGTGKPVSMATVIDFFPSSCMVSSLQLNRGSYIKQAGQGP